MSETFNAADIVDKTLIARNTVPVYSYPDDSLQPKSWVSKGDPVGVVYAWIGVNPAEGIDHLWWQFWDGINGAYYAPHEAGLYDVDALKQQGVLSEKEQAIKKEEENMPWYERLIKKYGGYVLLAVVGAAAVKGYLGRPAKNSS